MEAVRGTDTPLNRRKYGTGRLYRGRRTREYPWSAEPRARTGHLGKTSCGRTDIHASLSRVNPRGAGQGFVSDVAVTAAPCGLLQNTTYSKALARPAALTCSQRRDAPVLEVARVASVSLSSVPSTPFLRPCPPSGGYRGHDRGLRGAERHTRSDMTTADECPMPLRLWVFIR